MTSNTERYTMYSEKDMDCLVDSFAARMTRDFIKIEQSTVTKGSAVSSETVRRMRSAWVESGLTTYLRERALDFPESVSEAATSFHLVTVETAFKIGKPAKRKVDEDASNQLPSDHASRTGVPIYESYGCGLLVDNPMVTFQWHIPIIGSQKETE